MYIVKLQYKDSNEIMYSNENMIIEKQSLASRYDLKAFSTSLLKAKKIFRTLISRSAGSDPGGNGWYDMPKSLSWISIVELSNYEPYSEYQVIDFREFK